MKYYFSLLILFSIIHVSLSQDQDKTRGVFYKISLATTLAINEDYTIIDDDDTGPLIVPNALFVNNTIGYQFDHRTTLGLNAEYNYQYKQGLHFFPVYINMRHNIIVADNNVFIRAGYGKLLKLGNAFEKGTMYKIGLGYQIYDDDYRNSWLLGIDFNRKRFGLKETEKITSVAIFLEFMLF